MQVARAFTTEKVCCAEVVRSLRQRTCFCCCAGCAGFIKENVLHSMQVVRVLWQRTCGCAGCADVTTEEVLFAVQFVLVS